MTEETTSEQLAEIEGQGESTPATEYTPPEGWRVLAVGERLRDGDVTVRRDGYQYPTERVGGWVGSNQRYIRPIEPKPEPEPVQVREGRWRTRSGEVKNIRSCEPLKGAYYVWPWTDGFMTFQDNGLHQGSKESPNDLVEYLGPLEQQPKPQPQPQEEPESDAELRIGLLKQANDSQAETIARLLTEARDLNMEIGGLERQLLQRDARIRDLETMHAAATQAVVDASKVNDKLRAQIEELRSEVSYVQRLLGESRQRVTQLEELVGSLRTINEAQEQAFTAAGQDNTALRNQLAAVKAELVQERLERNRWHNQVLRVTAELDEKTTQCEILQIELDAAQQVPADSSELRQLRADLADVIQDRDTYRHAHELLVQDVNATHQRTNMMTIEAIVEWLVPIRTCGSQALATAVISNLPHIMRSLTGLEDEEIE